MKLKFLKWKLHLRIIESPILTHASVLLMDNSGVVLTEHTSGFQSHLSFHLYILIVASMNAVSPLVYQEKLNGEWNLTKWRY